MNNQKFNAIITNITRKTIPRFKGACFQCCFSTEEDSNAAAQQLLVERLPTSLYGAVTKRKAEFVAGRYLARLALESLNAADTYVGIKKNREPEWPSGFTGSISHTNRFAICAIAHDYDVKSIGIDVEEIVSAESAEHILNYALLDSEKEIVDGDLNLITLVFSAKESLFKALYSEVGFYFGFECARITLINQSTNSFKLELLKNLASGLVIGSTFDGFFELENGRVFTSICR